MASENPSFKFHQFPQLPMELRELIWDLVIRPDRPSAHFFSMFNTDLDDERAVLEEHALLEAPRLLVNKVRVWRDTEEGPQAFWEEVPAGRFRLAAPRCEENSSYSWTASNPSAYLVDSGLWTACSESQERMENHFRTQEFRRNYWGASLAGLAAVLPASGVFRLHGEKQLLTVQPNRDLFCFQPFDPETIVELEGNGNVMPSFYDAYNFEMRHMALEVGTEWWKVPARSDAARKLNPRFGGLGMLGLARRVEAGRRGVLWVWLLEKCLRRRDPNAPVHIPNGRHVFYGNGYKYVEVRDGDDDDGWVLDISDEERQTGETALDCAAWLESEFMYLAGESVDSDMDQDEYIFYRVLACLPAD
ncbi:hypothetical protein MFIFM68171_03038 [Madurella fahalii]|uniref:2EXR domain-containing protein n=1 Tax=Madurella fahalii TaxID=1157608 RepID=A0ABQ0G4Y6_9PEZI